MIMSTSPCGAEHDNVEEEDVAPVLQGCSPVDDPTATTIEEEGDNYKEIERLKLQLTREFEVKDLGQLRYFLGIEVSRSARGSFGTQKRARSKIILHYFRDVSNKVKTEARGPTGFPVGPHNAFTPRPRCGGYLELRNSDRLNFMLVLT